MASPGLLATPAMLETARRCVWFKDPEDALRYPEHFTAHVLAHGTLEDVRVLRRQVDDDELRRLIEHAPPGIFDKRSWAYWRLVLDMGEAPLPTRTCLKAV